MTGRSLSLFALVGSLATLVLVATMTGAGDTALPEDVVVATSEPVVAVTSNPIPMPPIPMPRSRAIYHFVRQQHDANRVMLASFER